jgi:hypothetical protein
MSNSGRNRLVTRGAGSRIHQGLVGARELIGTPYLADPELREEYTREIAPRTSVALKKVLGEIYAKPTGRGRPRRFLDLGAGTGAVGAALRAHFQGELDLVEVDRIAASAGTRIADITNVPGLAHLAGVRAPFDLVVSAHVLNELYVDQGPSERLPRLAALVKNWCEHLLGDGGTLILIEPALRETSRALLGVRDHLLAAGLHVVAPCFYTGPCPALLRQRDWCHDSAPSGAERVDFSYLVVRMSGEPTIESTLFRIVSDPLPEKGRLRLFGCGASGRRPIVRLDRHATTANADLDQLARGDVVRIVRTAFAQDGLRVVKDTIVARAQRKATTASPAWPGDQVPAE